MKARLFWAWYHASPLCFVILAVLSIPVVLAARWLAALGAALDA